MRGYSSKPIRKAIAEPVSKLGTGGPPDAALQERRKGQREVRAKANKVMATQAAEKKAAATTKQAAARKKPSK